MNEERITEGSSWSDPRGQVMKTPDDVAEMLRLKACGWGLKRIARQLGCSHHTVKDYVASGGVKRFQSPERPKRLDGQARVLRTTRTARETFFGRSLGCDFSDSNPRVDSADEDVLKEWPYARRHILINRNLRITLGRRSGD